MSLDDFVSWALAIILVALFALLTLTLIGMLVSALVTGILEYCDDRRRQRRWIREQNEAP